jgi:hypothetical protein
MSVARRIGAGAALTTMLVSVTFLASPATHAADLDAGARTITKTVARTHVEPDGTQLAVDSRTVTLTVSQTRSLRSRQPITVSWKGAHPTSGVVGDPNSAEARQQEYPFMLVECRGTDTAASPLRPETCWTGTSRERVLLDNNTAFPPWRLDRYETPLNRKKNVGVPDPLPPGDCYYQDVPAQRLLHFTGVNGRDYTDGSDSCPDVPPESVVVGNSGQPTNTTYSATQANGTGSTKFTVWTSEDNASLGCDGSVACTLVAVPIMGISCDVAAKTLPAADQAPAGKAADAARKRCEASGSYGVGQAPNGGSPDLSVTGSLWFNASNWRNRIAVPLDFAPLNNVCDIAGGKQGVDVYGSELMSALTTQWRPAFCLDRTKSPFKHVQVGEPQAANLLRNGTIKAAFVSKPPVGGYLTPTVNAPAALTGFSVSYTIDNADHDPYHQLKMTPRLLAKLLTQSYPGILPVKNEYDALSRNPLDISQDPEFIALNPGIRKGVTDSAQAATIINLSSDSDVVSAVTSYIKADAEARDFLYGVPDPWGMVVNPSYRRIALPVSAWPLLDSFEPKDYYAGGQNECLQANPVPILPLIAAPTSRLSTIALNLQFANSTPQLNCQLVPDKGAEGAKLVSRGRQTPGFRFVIGLTSLGDARRYNLDSAALQTHVKPGSPEKLTGPAGRTFITPSDTSLRVAAKLLKANDSTGTWDLSYDQVLTDSTAASAYPGSMLVYLAAPTSGLSPSDARAVAQLMSFAAGAGQSPGLNVGQLPPGYLPLTAANGLQSEAALTQRAAGAVTAQKGLVLNPSGATTAPPAAVPTTAPTTTTAVNGGTGVSDRPVIGPVVPASGVVLPSSLPAPSVAAPEVKAPVAALGLTPAAASAIAALLLPLLVVLGLIGASLSMLVNRFGRPTS